MCKELHMSTLSYTRVIVMDTSKLSPVDDENVMRAGCVIV